MRALALHAVFAALFLAVVSAQSLPVPSYRVGHAWGNGNAPVLVEMFADFQCIDSVGLPFPNTLLVIIQSFICSAAWPVVNKVLQHYGNKISFRYYQFPLWMHHEAVDVAVVRINDSD